MRIECFLRHHIPDQALHELIHLRVFLILSQEVLKLSHEFHHKLLWIFRVSNVLQHLLHVFSEKWH